MNKRKRKFFLKGVCKHISFFWSFYCDQMNSKDYLFTIQDSFHNIRSILCVALVGVGTQAHTHTHTGGGKMACCFLFVLLDDDK